MRADQVENELGRALRCEQPGCLVLQTQRSGVFAASRASQTVSVPTQTRPLPNEDALMLSLQLRSRPSYGLLVDGRRLSMDPVLPGASCFFDLRREFVAELQHPVEILLLYVPRAALDAVAEEEGTPRSDRLRVCSGQAVYDAVIRDLGTSLLPALEFPERANQLFVEQVSLALHRHLASAYAGLAWRRRPSASLTPPQERAAKELLAARLDGNVSLEQLADVCRMSRGHFTRAFELSTGNTPHGWLLQRRLARAEALLADSSLSIAEIAKQLGFAQLGHFTRSFARRCGVSPMLWRRSRRAERG